METGKISEKRIKAGNILLSASIVILSVALWNEYAWYEATAPLATLISFAFLVAMFFCLVPVKDAISDRKFRLVAAAVIVAGINIFLTGSGKGAWLTATDVLLVLYLSDRIKLSKAAAYFLLVYNGFYFFYWTFDVKGYFKGYNTNYGGLVLITGFVFAVTGMVVFGRALKKNGERGGAIFLSAFTLFMFAWGYNIIAWYRARCALLGFVVFAVMLIVPDKLWKSRAFYATVTTLMTAGAIVVSLVYVWLGRYASKLDIRIFYKDVISGRNEIWSDLWNAFLQRPLTGIGSSYTIDVDWMGGVFEVHNGLLDILIVHGVIVFAVVIYLLVERLMRLHARVSENRIAQCAVSAVFAILATSFMENGFIVPPFLLCTLALIAIAGSV